jgi:hypothetical protein
VDITDESLKIFKIADGQEKFPELNEEELLGATAQRG